MDRTVAIACLARQRRAIERGIGEEVVEQIEQRLVVGGRTGHLQRDPPAVSSPFGGGAPHPVLGPGLLCARLETEQPHLRWQDIGELLEQAAPREGALGDAVVEVGGELVLLLEIHAAQPQLGRRDARALLGDLALDLRLLRLAPFDAEQGAPVQQAVDDEQQAAEDPQHERDAYDRPRIDERSPGQVDQPTHATSWRTAPNSGANWASG